MICLVLIPTADRMALKIGVKARKSKLFPLKKYICEAIRTCQRNSLEKQKKSSIFNLDVKKVNLQLREFLIILKIPLFSKINLNEIKK